RPLGRLRRARRRRRAPRASRRALLRRLPRRECPLRAATGVDIRRHARRPRADDDPRDVVGRVRPPGAAGDLARLPAAECRPAARPPARGPRRRRGHRKPNLTDGRTSPLAGPNRRGETMKNLLTIVAALVLFVALAT